MQFINLIFLFGLLAISIPIIIHFLKKKKVKKLWLGSLRFLIEAQKAQRRNKSLKEYLLLLLRSLLIIGLVFVFMRPFFSSLDDFNKNESATVLLIDISGSMTGDYNNKNMFETSMAKAKQIIDELAESTNLTIACFADDVIEIKNIDTLKVASGTGTNYTKAIKWAQNKLLATKKKHMSVVMLTDMQVSGLPNDYLNDWSSLINFHLYPILSSGNKNQGIDNVTTTEAFIGQNNHVFPEFNLPEELSEKGIVDLFIEGKKVNSIAVDNNKGLVWKPERAGWYEGEVVLKQMDPWKFDNQYYFKLYASAPKSALIVNGYKGKSKFTDASYFVKSVFKVNEGATNTSIATTVKDAFSVEKEDLVVFCDVEKLAKNTVNTYKNYIENGGNAIFFLGNQTNENAINSLFEDGLFPVKLKRLENPTSRPVLSWNFKHDALKVFDNHNSGDVATIIFNEVYQLTPHPKATILASLNNGNPAITEIKYGKGTIIAIANSASRNGSDWPVSRMFLPLVRELSYYLVGVTKKADSQESLTCSILKHPNPGIDDKSKKVINHNIKESLVEVTTKAAFLKALGIQQANKDILEEVKHNATLLKNRQRKNEWSYYLVLILLGLLMAEIHISYNLK